jgi:uncharacterized membrane protein
VRGRDRLLAFDFARGLAVIAMIEAHAYGAWVRTGERATSAYRLTRFVATLALPTFLLLAGVGLAMRTDAAIRRGEPATRVRRELVVRGFEIVGAGYLVSLIGFVIDGGDFVPTVFRADVLHAIGLSLALYAGFGIRADASGSPNPRALAVTAGTLTFALTAGAVPLTRAARHVTGTARFLVAPFAEVPGLTKMPLVPLGAWLGLGVLFSFALARSRSRSTSPETRIAGADRRFLVGLVVFGSLVAFASYEAMVATTEWLGGPLDRAHPAIVWNVVDLGARAMVLVGLAGLATPRLPEAALSPVLLLGRHSLLAYAFHLPLAYGRIPKPIEGKLSMTTSTALVLALVVLTYAVARLVDAFEKRRRAKEATP